jgi:F0F1-type ATP synthase membrane subunit b/b'
MGIEELTEEELEDLRVRCRERVAKAQSRAQRKADEAVVKIENF